MKRLFVIGNGFDCYLHKLPTKYENFREYIIKRFPGADEYDELVPESFTLPDGDETMIIEEVAGYLTGMIDECEGVYWSNLEYSLGSKIFDILYYDLEKIPWDGSDKETMHAIYRNEGVASLMKQAFGYMKQLFFEWVDAELANIEYSGMCIPTNLQKTGMLDTIKGGDGFLSFNYTTTLEDVYGITPLAVCHIHGKAGDSYEDIFFGHGDKSGVPQNADSIGADLYLEELKRDLRKDTENALRRNSDFFAQIDAGVESIYSYGFAFSDVDMIYIDEISKRVDKEQTIWYLNSYDGDERPDGITTSKRQKLEELGFNVQVDRRW